jgi:hypothetical protein
MIAPITDSLFHENIQFILKDTAATSRRQLSYNTTIKGQNDDEPVSFILTDESATKYYKKYHKDSLVTEISGMQIKTEF